MRAKATALFILLTVLLMSASAQPKPFELTIHIGGIQLYEAGLEFPIDNQGLKEKITVTKKDHGVYVAKGVLEYPTAARLEVIRKRSSVTFFIEPGVQQIRTHIDSLRRPIGVEGSQSNEEYLHRFLPAMEPHKKAADELSKNYNTLYSRYDEKIPPRVEDSLLAVHEKNNDLRNALVQQYIQAHPTSYVGFWMLYELLNKYSYKEAYEKAFSSLHPAIRRSPDAMVFRTTLYTTKQYRPGKPFPHLQLVDSTGVRQALPTAAARYTLVDFWYSNCSPCIAQFEKLKELYGRYGANGFTIIGVSTDKAAKEEDWKRIMVKYALPWPQLWDVEGQQAQMLNIRYFPTNFLLDATGKIVLRDLEPFQLEMYLDQHLK